MPTPTLNTQGGALMPQNNGQTSAFGTPTELNSFVGGINTLPGVPNPTPPPPKTVAVVTPKLAQTDLTKKQDTTTGVAAALQTQTQNKLTQASTPPGTTDNLQQQQNSQQSSQTQTPQNTQTSTGSTSTNTYTPPTNATSVTLPNGVQAFYDSANQSVTTATGQQLQFQNGAWVDPTTGQPPTPQGTTPTTNGQVPQTGDPTTDYVNQQLQQNQQLADQASAQHQQQLQQLINGTFPLTADQQSQIAGLQSQYSQLETLQKQANDNYTAATKLFGIRNGGQYEPGVLAKSINDAVSSGINKLTTLDTQAASAVATLKSGFLNNDYTAINAAYKDLTDAITSKDNTLQKIQDNVTKAVQVQTEKIQQQTALLANQTASINSIATSAYQQSVDANGQIDLNKLTQIAITNGVDPQALYGAAVKAQQAQTAVEQQDATFASQQLQAKAQLEATNASTANTQANTAKTYNDIAQTNLTNTPEALAPYINTFYDGTKYADLSSLTPSDKVKYAQVAQAAGIKPILDTATAGKLNAISASKENLTKIGDQVKNILNTTEQPSSQGIGNTLKSFFGDADIKAFSAWRTAVINNVQALAGGQGSGLRINQAEIDTALQNDLPVITGVHADNLQTANQKITNLNAQLDTWSKQILGGGNQAKTNAPQVTAGSTITYQGKQYSVDAQGNLTPQ